MAAGLADEIERLGIAGAIYGIEQAGNRQIAAVGSRNLDHDEPMTADTSVAALSLVKPMTASLAIKGVREGLLALDQPVAEILSGRSPPFSPAVTVRRLLSMTAGLAEVPLEPPAEGDSHDAVASLVARQGLAEEPGTVWSYSNPAFAVLGRVLEVAIGSSWDELLRQHLLRPLGMTASRTMDEAPSGPVASDHVRDGVGRQIPVPGISMRAFAAAGTWLLTTADDLLSFAVQLGRDPALAALRSPQVDVPVRTMADRWCLGVAEFDWRTLRAWGWDGIGIGSRHVLRVIPDRQFAFVLLTNSDRGRLLLRTSIPSLVSELLGVEVPRGFDPIRAESQRYGQLDLSAYQGEYHRPGLPPAIVTAAQGKLEVEDLEGRRVLTPLDRSTFLADERDPDEPTVTFSRFDEMGRPRSYYRTGFCFSRS